MSDPQPPPATLPAEEYAAPPLPPDLAVLSRTLPALLLESEVADLLRVHIRTISRAAASGRLPPPFQFGSVKRYARDAVLAAIAAGRPEKEAKKRMCA